MKLQNYLCVFLLLTSLFSCDNEPVDSPTVNQEIIEVNSELFNLVQRTVGDDDPLEDISCIEFIYPLSLFTFDENHTLTGAHYIANNDEFISLLNSLDYTESISISYPISGTLSSGSQILIETNQDLKLAIQECLEEEEINECEGLLKQCLWQVTYTDEATGIYTGSYFIEDSGVTIYELDGQTFLGSWSAFFIEEELHLNIYLNEENETSSFWNKDWKVSYVGNIYMQLTWEDQVIILHQVCGEFPPTCGNEGLTFSECEMETDSQQSEFVLNNYSECILELTLFDDLTPTESIVISYHETQDDSENDINSIDSSTQYINLSPTQTIWVRIENTLTGDYTIIPITLTVTPC